MMHFIMCRSQVSFPKPLTTSAGTIASIIFIAYVDTRERRGMWIQEVLHALITHELKNHFLEWMWFALWSPQQVPFNDLVLSLLCSWNYIFHT